jgi:hypothetical protein
MKGNSMARGYFLSSIQRRTPPAAGIYQQVTCLLTSKRLPSRRQPDAKTEDSLVLSRPLSSVVRELAF